MPAQKDDDLSAIMARRRQLTDSGRDVLNSGKDPFASKTSRTQTTSTMNSTVDEGDSSHMRSDLYKAMMKRRMATQNGSIHQSPRQKNKEKFKHVKVDSCLQDKLQKRRLVEDSAQSVSVESGTIADDENDDNNKSVGDLSVGTFVQEYAAADASVQHSELSSKLHFDEEEDNLAESSVSENDLGDDGDYFGRGIDTESDEGAYTSDDHDGAYTSDDNDEAYTSEDNEPYLSEDKDGDCYTYNTVQEYAHVEDFGEEQDQANDTDEDNGLNHAGVSVDESSYEEQTVESSQNPLHQHENSFFAQPSINTLGTLGSLGSGKDEFDLFERSGSVKRDDSFFATPDSMGPAEEGNLEEMDYDTQSSDEEELGRIAERDEDEAEDDDSMEEQIAYEQTLYEEQAVIDDEADSAASDEDEQLEEIAEESEDEEVQDDDDDDEEKYSYGDQDGGNEAEFSDGDQDGENDAIYEIDTLGSSFYSNNASGDGWSVDEEERRDVIGGALGNHLEDTSNSAHYDDFDGERSILGGLSVLDVVHEDEDEEGGQDSIDHDIVFGGKIVDGRIDRDVPMGSDDGHQNDNTARGDEVVALNSSSEHEQAPLKDGLGKKTLTPCCSWPWTVFTVLMCSVALGVGIGVFLRGGTKDKKSVSNERESGDLSVPENPGLEATAPPTQPPTGNPESANVPPEIVETYDLICSVLDNCDDLLNMFTPQGLAFDWLVNDKSANPGLELIPADSKIRRYALASFYFSTEGVSWENKTNWLSSEHECNWFSTADLGTGCGIYSKEFSTLALDNNNVQGELPYELALLSSLTSISLRNPVDTLPSIRGSLSPHLGALSLLTSVVISGNQFSSDIPSELGKLINIETLDLSANGLNGEIPTAFASLSKLTTLRLSDNFLTGDIDPSFFEGAKGLIEVNLERNLLTGVPTSIIGLTQLRSLNLASNKLSTIPLAVTQLVDLSILDLRKNGFTGKIPVQLGRMTSLRRLDLSGNTFTGDIPVEIGNLVKLDEALDLSNNELTGPIPSRLGLLVELKRLRLNSNKLTGELPVELAALDKIEEMRVDDNDLTGVIPEDICTLYELQRPAAYADCEEFESASCFTYCCTDAAGCLCRFEKTDPLRCIKGLQ